MILWSLSETTGQVPIPMIKNPLYALQVAQSWDEIHFNRPK